MIEVAISIIPDIFKEHMIAITAISNKSNKRTVNEFDQKSGRYYYEECF